MGQSIFFFMWICCIDHSPRAAVFVASTPCSQGTRPAPGIPKEGGCELIKWRLQLFKDTYMLDCDYGMPKQGTRGFVNGGHHVHREGKWRMEGKKVLRLDPGKPAESISFLRLNGHLLHLLDGRQRLMIGNGAWSYTLNRIQQ